MLRKRKGPRGSLETGREIGDEKGEEKRAGPNKKIGWTGKDAKRNDKERPKKAEHSKTAADKRNERWCSYASAGVKKGRKLINELGGVRVTLLTETQKIEAGKSTVCLVRKRGKIGKNPDRARLQGERRGRKGSDLEAGRPGKKKVENVREYALTWLV